MRPADHIYTLRDEWLEARRETVGASEVATILGENPYEDAYALYSRKVGDAPPVDNMAVRMGHVVEPVLAEAYVEETGREVEDFGPYTVWAHPEHPWLRATPDRVTTDGDRVVELKMMNPMAAKALKDGAKLAHQVQLQIQMACLDVPRGDIAVGIMNQGLEVFDFERDDELIDLVIPSLEEFHRRLLENDPPPPTDVSLPLVRHQYDRGDGTHAMLTPEAIEAAQTYVEGKDKLKPLRKQIREIEKDVDEAQAIILEAMKNASFAEGGGFAFELKDIERKGYTVAPKRVRQLKPIARGGDES